eukprot:10668656-Karenia_brevis.AAC.1
MSYLTESVFKLLNLPQECNKKSKADWWKQLVQHKCFIDCGNGKYFPSIAFNKNASATGTVDPL